MDRLNPQGAIDPGWRAARRVLLVRLDNLGDLLMTTPAFAAVRRGLPAARLTLLASPSGAAALPYLPMLDDAIAYAAPWVRQPAASPVAKDHQVMTALAAGGFDAAIVFSVCTQSALPAAMLCRLAGIPLRLAYSRENPYELLSHWVPDTERIETGMRHEVRRQLDLAASVGVHIGDERMVFRCRPGDFDAARARLAEAGCQPGAPYVVVHVGATAASRRYPAERFAAAADGIAAASGCQIVFTGADDEASLIDAARASMRMPSISLAGRLDIGQLGALLADAQLLVSNNTGPVHIAAALGTPVVVLYALTNPQHTPWQTPARVLFKQVACGNCLKSICPERHHQCLQGVEPARVVQAALELLARGRRADALAAGVETVSALGAHP